MAEAKINHNKILHNPEAAVAKQLLIPAALTNSIISKRMLGIFDRTDQLQLAAETISAINYIAEHDHLAYLIFIDRFDLIRELFWKKELFGDQLALIDALEKEEEQEKNQQFQAIEQARQSLLLRQQQEQTTQAQEHRLKDEKALINMDLYSYYVHREQKIHNDFHVQQIQILDKSYTGRVARINRVVDLAENDPLITVEDKTALKKLLKDYQEEYEAVRQMPIHKEDGAIDPEALKTKSETAKQIESKFRLLFDQILIKYDHLKGIHEEEIKANIATDGQLIVNETVRNEHLAENNEHLVEIKEITQDELNNYVNNSFDILNGFDIDKLPESQRSEFQQSMGKLENFKTQLNQTEDQVHRKELTKQCVTELNYLSELVKPQMSSPSFKELASNVLVLNELKIKTNAIPIAFSEPQLSDSKSHANDASMPSKDPQPVETQVHSTAMFRQQMASMREHVAIKQETQNSRPEQEVSEVRKLEEEHEDDLEGVTSDLPDITDNIIENYDVSAEEKEMIQQIKEICEGINPTIRDGVNVSQTALLKTNLDLLQDKFSEFSKFASRMESIQESFEPSSRPHM